MSSLLFLNLPSLRECPDLSYYCIRKVMKIKSVVETSCLNQPIFKKTNVLPKYFKWLNFKFTFERLRPCAQEGVLEYIRQGECWGFGFFSGHSSNSMATAIFTGLMLRPIYKNVIYYMIVWSVVVAYSRIYLGLHYPLDILCGLSFGAFAGYLFYNIFTRLQARFVKV